MGLFTWYSEEVPEGMKTTQVYGIVFTTDGRLLLKVEKKHGKTEYSFAGGTPESFDSNRIATLRRELIEEVNTTIKDEIYLVGYQKVDEGNGKAPYAQVRMTALIDKVGVKKPDPDNGRTYERLLTTPERAIKLLGWDTAEGQINEAVRIAKEKLNIKEFSTVEEYI